MDRAGQEAGRRATRTGGTGRRPAAPLPALRWLLVGAGSWLLSAAFAAPGLAQPAEPRILQSIQVQGGSVEDQRFARSALGLHVGQGLSQEALAQALAAVRLVDRYRSVEGTFEPGGSLVLRLEPLEPVKRWIWTGDPVPSPLRKDLLPELQRGQRLGAQRLGLLCRLARQRLRDAGYPQVEVAVSLAEGGAAATFQVRMGPPRLIRDIQWQGDPAPYTPETLLKVAGLQPGRTLWTVEGLREAQRRLRQRLVKDRRLEGTVRLEPGDAEGQLRLEVVPGPRVTLRAEGLGFLAPLWGQPRLAEFVPLARADRYSPSLLEEGAGRITTYFRNQGYPEARVTWTRDVIEGAADHPSAVRVTYRLVRGVRRSLGQVRFEGNRELTEEELRPAATLPKRWLVLPPHAKADVVKALEDRVTALYLQRGFPEVRVRRKVETAADGSVEVRLVIREGARHVVGALLLELPDDPAYQDKGLERALLLALGERPVKGALPGTFRSDRKHLQGLVGTLSRNGTGARLSVEPPLPLVRNDLALVVSDLRQRLASLGAANPQVKLVFEEDAATPTVRIRVPVQPLDRVRRLVVQGSDRTRAEAVLREVDLVPGTPLDPAKVDEGQVRVGGLGAFQRVDLLTLKDLPGQEQEPWQRGDLALRLQERSPWVFTESFGYDKTQGYHFGWNAQRLNVGGMGRVLDFGLRAGDQTLGNPTLRRAFPTGDVTRSVDSYSVGYTDPWFLPGALDAWLPSRTRFHTDAAYIEEAQAAFFARRRRLQSNLEWRPSPVQQVQLGYRFERVEVAANTANGLDLSSDELFLIAKTPARSIISAPYLQVTVDRRDRPYDPTQGTYFLGRLDLANQVFGTSANSSFIKLDLRHQWNWPVGFHAESGVFTASVRVGLARPTAQSAEDLPLSERFFGGGPSTVRGVEPDMLGKLGVVPTLDGTSTQIIPLGGQAIAAMNLEYRFPLFGQSVWGELFVDAGQVYRTLHPAASEASPFPPLRVTPGIGLILKLGFPLKLEYAADWKRILGRPRTEEERVSQLKSLLISAGFQF